MSKRPQFMATINLGYVTLDVETTANNLGEPTIEFRETGCGYSLQLSIEGALMLAETLKAVAIAK